MEHLSDAEIREFLVEETIFRGAPPAGIDRLASVAVEKRLPRGGTLFSMGQSCDALHFVALGSAALVQISMDGRERLLHRALAGDMVGAVPFFDGGVYPATLVAETECSIISLPRVELLRILASDPALSLCLVGGLVDRLRRVVALVEKISFEDVTRRLWDYLIERSSPAGASLYPRTLDPLPTRESIAVAVGSVREVISRRLSHLVDTGHVRIEGRRLTILKGLA